MKKIIKVKKGIIKRKKIHVIVVFRVRCTSWDVPLTRGRNTGTSLVEEIRSTIFWDRGKILIQENYEIRNLPSENCNPLKLLPIFIGVIKRKNFKK